MMESQISFIKLNRDELVIISQKINFCDMTTLSKTCTQLNTKIKSISNDKKFWIKQDPDLKRLYDHPKVFWSRVGNYLDMKLEDRFMTAAKLGDLWYLKTINLDPHSFGMMVWETLKISLLNNRLNVVKYIFNKIRHFRGQSIFRHLYQYCLENNCLEGEIYLKRISTSFDCNL